MRLDSTGPICNGFLNNSFDHFQPKLAEHVNVE
jgi:hypothetical protein